MTDIIIMKKIICEKCGKGFSNKGNRNKHIRGNKCKNEDIINYNKLITSTKVIEVNENNFTPIQFEKEENILFEMKEVEKEQKIIAEEKERQHIAEQKRIAEEKERQHIAEQKRIAEEKERQHIEEQKRIKEEKERQRIMEQKRITEEKERQHIMEQKRIAEEKERQHIMEQKRIAEEKERQHIAEQKRIAEEKEQQRIMEQKRIAEQKRIEEEKEKQRIIKEKKEKEIKEQEEKRRQLIKQKELEQHKINIDKQNKELENEKNEIKENLKYYDKEMKELEYVYNENVVLMETELQNCNLYLENESISELEYRKNVFKINLITKLQEEEKKKYINRRKELIKIYNETINDKKNLNALKNELIDISKTFEEEKIEKMSSFDDARLFLSRLVRNKDKNKLRRTARNRSYKNIKKEKDLIVYDENIKDKRKRRINILRNRLRNEGIGMSFECEKPKINIDLNDVYDDIKAELKQNITINANGKHNKTLKNEPFRKIKLIS